MAFIVQNINAVAERLTEVPELPRDTILLVLTGFTKFSVPEFVGPFELRLNNERVINLDNDGDMHVKRKCLEWVKKLTLLESNSFHYLNVFNKWNIPSNHWNGMSKRKVPCNNCDGEHYSPYYPHPRDKANIKKAKEERAARRDGGGYGGGYIIGRGGRQYSDLKKWSNDN